MIKVLIVEDSAVVRQHLKNILEEDGGIRVVGMAENGEESLKFVQKQKPDVITMDINMPGMNGLKFAQQIRTGKTHAKPETRIVVLTSFSQTEILGTALALDINGFLVKPVIPAVVEEKLAKAMSERLHLHPPMAYEVVKTELQSLPTQDNQSPVISHKPSITLGVTKASNNSSGSPKGHRLALSRLHPGMLLTENVYFKDGTLVLSSGHTLSELSINRLNDLKELLPAEGIAVQERNASS